MEAAVNSNASLALQDRPETPDSRVMLAIPEASAARIRKQTEPLKDKEISQTLLLGVGLIVLIMLAALLGVLFAANYAAETFLIPAGMLAGLVATGLGFFTATVRTVSEKPAPGKPARR